MIQDKSIGLKIAEDPLEKKWIELRDITEDELLVNEIKRTLLLNQLEEARKHIKEDAIEFKKEGTIKHIPKNFTQDATTNDKA